MDKRAKKREYKETPRIMSVCQIKNNTNGKVLIGSSINLPAMLNRFRAELKMGRCRNSTLQDDWNRYGPEAFEFVALETLKPKNEPGYDPAEDLHILDELWIEKLTPFSDKGYNKLPKSFS